MRRIFVTFTNFDSIQLRKASKDWSTFQIKTTHGSVIVKSPTIRRSLVRGVSLMDQRLDRINTRSFHQDTTPSRESNKYTDRNNYDRWRGVGW